MHKGRYRPTLVEIDAVVPGDFKIIYYFINMYKKKQTNKNKTKMGVVIINLYFIFTEII
jgi:hypothetical protein